MRYDAANRGSLATLAAMRRASSRRVLLAADRHPGLSNAGERSGGRNDTTVDARAAAGEVSEPCAVLALLADPAHQSPEDVVLISAGFLEQQLKDILLAFMLKDAAAEEFVEGGNAPLGTFSSEITAAYLLGLLSTDEHNDLKLIRKIRNDFAHEVETTFNTPSVVDRCKLLKYKAEDYGEVKMGAFGQFQSAAVGLIMNLTNRAAQVSQQRRNTRTWP